jgi:hypothetical protein
MEHNAETDWFIRENIELHRQLRTTMAFLQKCYESNRGAKGITAPTEQEWQDIFDMLREVRPSKNKRGFDLISDVLPFGPPSYGEPNAVSNAIGYAMHNSRSHDTVIRVYDAAGSVIEPHQHKGDFRKP